jgi:signal recognition particle subunit SRP54
MLRGHFTLDDFLEQLQMLQNMGPLQDLLDKVPFFADSVPDGFQVDEREIGQIKAIVSSMTRQERAKAELFRKQPTRLTRVAKGSGTAEKQVTEILQRFTFMKQMMGNIGSQAGMLSKIPGMKQMAAANRLRDAVKIGGLEGNPMMANLTDSLLEAAVAEHGGFGPGPGQAPRKVVNKNKQKSKRKMQKKSRRKSRR